MTEETETQEEEQQGEQTSPRTVWDKYVGQVVCLQLNAPYFAVTAPTTFARSAQGEFATLPLMRGRLNAVNVDGHGNVMLQMLLPDPNTEVKSRVSSEIRDDLVTVISVSEGGEEESRIIT